MKMELRPMTLGEILDRAFQIYRQKFLSLVAVAMIPAVLILAIRLVDMAWLDVHSLLTPPRQPGIFVWNMLVALGFYHLAVLAGLPFSAAYVKQTSSVIFDEACTLQGSLGIVRARWGAYFWITVLKTTGELIIPEILAFGLAIGMVYPLDAAGLMNEPNAWVTAIMILLPTVLGVSLFLWVGACLSFSIPACALEDRKGFKALRRSWILSRTSRGRVITAWLLFLIFGWAVSWGLQILLRWGLIYLYWHFHLRQSAHFYEAVFYVLRAALASVLAPLYPIALTLIYYDQRIRHEGFDIEWMMNAAGMNAIDFGQPAVVTAGAAESGEQST